MVPIDFQGTHFFPVPSLFSFKATEKMSGTAPQKNKHIIDQVDSQMSSEACSDNELSYLRPAMTISKTQSSTDVVPRKVSETFRGTTQVSGSLRGSGALVLLMPDVLCR